MQVPRHFQMQWHITERCNLRCKHCYQHSWHKADPPFVTLQFLLQRLIEAVEAFSREQRHAMPARITLTGGEPFLRPDFFDLLGEIVRHRKLVRWAILTNGTLIDRGTARQLARWKPDYVQVSLDGMKETHEELRGQGSFDPAVEGVRQLVRAGVRTLISFTASRRNVDDFPAVARLGAELGVHRVWADRLIPTTPEQYGLSLTPEETRAFFETMLETRQSLQCGFFRRIGTTIFGGIFGGKRPVEIAMHRALQFLVGGGAMYRCSAGRSLVAILPDGTVLPCRRLPIPVGNLLETPLVELWRSSELLQGLRDSDSPASSQCSQCVFSQGCHGGLRCLAYATTGDPFSRDPGCWLCKVSSVNAKASQPTLMRLRELEVIEKIAESGKLNLVVGEKGVSEKIVNLL